MNEPTTPTHQYRVESLGIRLTAELPAPMTWLQWIELLSLAKGLFAMHQGLRPLDGLNGSEIRLAAFVRDENGSDWVDWIDSPKNEPLPILWEHRT